LTPVTQARPKRPLYQAYPGEKVVLAGGPTVPADAFKPVTDAEVFARLPGFRPIPFEKIGLQKTVFRQTLPAEVRPVESLKPSAAR
jgi:hypothetical protein